MEESNTPFPEIYCSDSKQINPLGVMNTQMEKDLNSNVVENRKKAMEKLEKLIIQTQLKCPDDIINHLRVRAFQIDFDKVNKVLKTSFDQEFYTKMGCLVDALIFQNHPFPDYQFRKWLVATYKLSGYTDSPAVVINKHYSIFVIKALESNEDTGLVHEAIVTMGALNNLRGKVPNFVYTYGAFMCYPPVLGNSNDFLWCSANAKTKDIDSSNVTYLVSENLQDGVPLSEMLGKLDPDELLQIYLQVFNALYVAYKDYDFTHYNLSPRNIIVLSFNEYLSIPFYYGEKKYIRTKYLAKINDFRFSHVKIKNQDFGTFYLLYGIKPESYPMYDVYKLLVYTYYLLKSSKSNLITLVEKLYEFFGSNVNVTLKERVRVKEMKFFSKRDRFQPYDNLRHLKFENLFDFILSKFPVSHIITNDIRDTKVTICESKCMDWNRFHRLVFNDRKLPSTIEDYCQALVAIEKLKSESEKKELKQWLKKFDIYKAYKIERTQYINMLNNVIRKINEIEIPDFGPVYEKNVLSFNKDRDFPGFKDIMTELIKIRSDVLDLMFWLESVKYSFKDERYKDVKEQLDTFETRLNGIKNKFLNYRETIERNLKNPKFRDAVEMSSRVKLYIKVITKGFEDIDIEKL